MGITVNTNMQAIRIQNNLNTSTKKMNTAMERMSSGYKINSSKDDATGYAVSATLQRNLSGTKVAMSNVSLADDMLSTAEGALSVMTSNIQRVRDLVEQAANGTYSTSDISGVVAEIKERLTQVKSIADNTEFNGTKLFQGNSVRLQVGVNASDSMTLSGANAGDIFHQVDISSLAKFNALTGAIEETVTNPASGGDAYTLVNTLHYFVSPPNPATVTRQNIADFLGTSVTPFNGTAVDGLDAILNDLNTRITNIGATSERLNAVTETLNVTKENLTSALSTVRDADIAEESANFVQQQILQSASATLLTQANSAPQIALTLIQG